MKAFLLSQGVDTDVLSDGFEKYKAYMARMRKEQEAISEAHRKRLAEQAGQ